MPIVRLGDLSIGLRIEWSDDAQILRGHIGSILDRLTVSSGFRKLVVSYLMGFWSNPKTIAVVYPVPNSRDIRKLLLQNSDVLLKVLIEDWLVKFGERFVVIKKDGTSEVIRATGIPRPGTRKLGPVIIFDRLDGEYEIPAEDVMYVVNCELGIVWSSGV